MDFEQMVRESRYGEDHKEKESPVSGARALELAQALPALVESYEQERDFDVGDMVVWKDDMDTRSVPKRGEPVVVLEFGTCPLPGYDLEPSRPWDAEPLDMRVGGIVKSNADRDLFATYWMSSTRFRRYTPGS